MSGGVGHRLGLDLELLWLWGRPSLGTSYATNVALKKDQKKNSKTKKNDKKKPSIVLKVL